AEYSCRHVERRLCGNTNQAAWFHAFLHQMMSQLVRALIEFPVSEGILFMQKGDRLRCLGGLLFEGVMDCQIRWIASRSVIPVPQELLAFRFRQERELGNLLVRVFYTAID